MTEAEWLECAEPERMLEHLLLRKLLHGPASERKLRLLACACCRRNWERVTEPTRKVIEANEQYADGVITYNGVRTFLEPILDPEPGSAGERYPRRGLSSTERSAWHLSVRQLGRAQAQNVMDDLRAGNPKRSRHISEASTQASLVREIFGNPFRLRVSRKAWLLWNDRTIPKMAEAIYTDRAFDRLPILGDALEDAGCTNRDILDHCRGPGPHVRGCWVVDLVLDKK